MTFGEIVPGENFASEQTQAAEITAYEHQRTAPGAASLQLHVLRAWEDLEGVRHFWQKSAKHPNAGYASFSDVLRSRADVIRPHVLLLATGGQPLSLVLCRLENMRSPLRLGYTSLGHVRVRTLVVMHQGVLGDLDEAGAELVVGELRAALRRGEADRILFNAVPEASCLAGVSLRTSTGWERGFLLNREIHWAAAIPSQPGEFLAAMKSKHRSWLRKMQRDLEASYPASVFYARYSRPEDIGEALRQVECVAQKAYQRGIGVGVRNDTEHFVRFTEAARSGRLRIWLLHAGGAPRAYRIGEIYGETIHGVGIGYDPDLGHFRLGHLLLLHVIDELANDGIRRYDFGLGDAAYKQQFGTEFWQDVTFSIFSGGIHGQLAKALIALPFHVGHRLRWVLVRLNLLDRVKKFIRNRMAGNARSSALSGIR